MSRDIGIKFLFCGIRYNPCQLGIRGLFHRLVYLRRAKKTGDLPPPLNYLQILFWFSPTMVPHLNYVT